MPKKKNEKDVEAAVQWMLAEGKAAGNRGGTAPCCVAAVPNRPDPKLSALSGVMLYEPEELVLSAKAATPLAESQALVASRGQHRVRAHGLRDHSRPLIAGRGYPAAGRLAANLSGPPPHSRPAPRVTIFSASPPCPARGDLQIRWPRGEERDRIGSVQVDRRLLGHARRHDRGDDRCRRRPKPRRRSLIRGL